MKKPFDQETVDLVRCRVMTAMLASGAVSGKTEYYERVWHLWFPEARADGYELRTGNPPADQDRPKHLRRMNLVLDLTEVPAEVWDEVKERQKAHSKSRERLVKGETEFILEGGNLIKPAHLL